MKIVVPLATVSGMNAREHFRARASRVKKERQAIAWCLKGQPYPPTPCSVMLTRVAWSNGLDDDNLRSALKGVRDQIAEWLGVDDRHSNQVRYFYDQRRASAPKQAEVWIEFGQPQAGAQFELLPPRIDPSCAAEAPLPF
jgi:hypothetical protein